MPGRPLRGRTWTVAEANDALPGVEGMIVECRGLLEDLRGIKAHLDDLRIVWGDALRTRSCPGREEDRLLLRRFREARLALEEALERFEGEGIQVKDLDVGLVDFPTLLGEEVVLLCYRSGEGAVGHWHPRRGGYASRRPLPDLEGLDAVSRA